MSPTTDDGGRTVGCSSTIFHDIPDQLLLKEGGQIPGYVGHCPLLRYDFGKTFGEGTHDAYMKRKNLSFLSGRDLNLQDSWTRVGFDRSQTTIGSPGVGTGRPQEPITVRERSQEIIHTKKGRERRPLPEYDGYNKYTENMVPGYTGYIPRYPFQFGNTYKEECDVCLDEHFSNLERQRDQRSEHARRTTHSAASLTPIRQDPLVRDRLNTFSGPQHPGASLTPRLGVYNPPVLDKNCELPIPGYRGYIPRVRTTEIGLGTRYTEQTKNGLDSFYEKKADREAKLGLKKRPGCDKVTSSLTSSREITIDRNPVTIESTRKWSSNCNGRGNGEERPATIMNGQSDSGQSYLCERRDHDISNTREATRQNKVPKSVAFVV